MKDYIRLLEWGCKWQGNRVMYFDKANINDHYFTISEFYIYILEFEGTLVVDCTKKPNMDVTTSVIYEYLFSGTCI